MDEREREWKYAWKMRLEEMKAVERERDGVREALQEALAYVPDYFREKWNLDAPLSPQQRSKEAANDC